MARRNVTANSKWSSRNSQGHARGSLALTGFASPSQWARTARVAGADEVVEDLSHIRIRADDGLRVGAQRLGTGRAREAIGDSRLQRVVADAGPGDGAPRQGRVTRSLVVGKQQVRDLAGRCTAGQAGVLVGGRLAAEQAIAVLVERSTGERIRALGANKFDLCGRWEYTVNCEK